MEKREQTTDRQWFLIIEEAIRQRLNEWARELGLSAVIWTMAGDLRLGEDGLDERETLDKEGRIVKRKRLRARKVKPTSLMLDGLVDVPQDQVTSAVQEWAAELGLHEVSDPIGGTVEARGSVESSDGKFPVSIWGVTDEVAFLEST